MTAVTLMVSLVFFCSSAAARKAGGGASFAPCILPLGRPAHRPPLPPRHNNNNNNNNTDAKPQPQGLALGFVLLRVESLVEEGKL
jgi:hypothetical protein